MIADYVVEVWNDGWVVSGVYDDFTFRQVLATCAELSEYRIRRLVANGQRLACLARLEEGR